MEVQGGCCTFVLHMVSDLAGEVVQAPFVLIGSYCMSTPLAGVLRPFMK
jgi:hypothetical protein